MSTLKIKKHKRKYYKLSTKGATKGKIVDTSFDPPKVVTKEHTASVKANISKSAAEVRDKNRRWLAKNLTGSETPFVDANYKNKARQIDVLEGKYGNVPGDRLRRFLSAPTAEGGTVFDYQRQLKINKLKEELPGHYTGTSMHMDELSKPTENILEAYPHGYFGADGKFIQSSGKSNKDYSTGTGVQKEDTVTHDAEATVENIKTGESKDLSNTTKPNVEVKEKNVKSELAIDKPKKYNKDLLKAGFTTDQLDDLRDRHDSWKAARASGTLGDWEATNFPDRTPRYKNKKKKKNRNKLKQGITT
jgi:hypothetical protein